MVHERRSRKLTRDANTTLSAVAVLERIQPNRHLVTDHLAQLALEGTEAIVRATHEFLEAHPEVQAEALRLRVIHNPFARIPLPRHVFSGPHDEHQS